MQTQSIDPIPWYRQPWPWFLIALPAAAVIGGIVTTILAVLSADGVVAADYYKRGLAINDELSRGQRARDLGLSAELSVDGVDAGDRVRLHLRAAGALPADVTLQVRLLHPGRSAADRTVMLTRSAVDPENRAAHYVGAWADSTPASRDQAVTGVVIESSSFRLDGPWTIQQRSGRIDAQ